jgi:hypothetical protein
MLSEQDSANGCKWQPLHGQLACVLHGRGRKSENKSVIVSGDHDPTGTPPPEESANPQSSVISPDKRSAQSNWRFALGKRPDFRPRTIAGACGLLLLGIRTCAVRGSARFNRILMAA